MYTVVYFMLLYSAVVRYLVLLKVSDYRAVFVATKLFCFILCSYTAISVMLII